MLIDSGVVRKLGHCILRTGKHQWAKFALAHSLFLLWSFRDLALLSWIVLLMLSLVRLPVQYNSTTSNRSMACTYY